MIRMSLGIAVVLAIFSAAGAFVALLVASMVVFTPAWAMPIAVRVAFFATCACLAAGLCTIIFARGGRQLRACAIAGLCIGAGAIALEGRFVRTGGDYSEPIGRQVSDRTSP